MKVSIVIPCKNEANYIAKCLDSIVALNYDKTLLDVRVCDGKSDDQTPAIIRSYEAQHSYIHYHLNENQTTPFALNLGINNSLGDIIIILGAHSELQADYVKECLNAFEVDEAIGCVGGVIDNVSEDETSTIIALAMSSGFGVGSAHFRTGNKEGFVDTVAFGAYKKEVFEKVGLFDEALTRNQDDEFNFRVLQGGYKVYLSKSIRSKYYVRASYNKLYRQYYQYGYWKVFVNKKHKTITTVRQLVPLFFVLFLFGGALLSLLSLYIWLMYMVVLFLYLNLAAVFAVRLTKKPEWFLRIIFVFSILHFGYGLGYLVGLFDFFLLNKQPRNSSANITR